MDRAATWLKDTLDYEFRDAELLRQALTHRSASGRNNERLEFLGDAVLDLVISEAVFADRPDAGEGALSRLRSAIVKDTTLAEVAAALGIGAHLVLGSGEKKAGGHRRASILADALEAVFGAVYLDNGLAAAQQVILNAFAERLDRLPDPETLRDPKSRLQEYLQARQIALPEYSVDDVRGKAHRQTFEVSCTIGALDICTLGVGSSRRAAEQAAARAMLAHLEASP